jgi:hypothetical protein
MSAAYNWAARFLLLVMLAPAYEPLAMAQCCAKPQAMHCMRMSAAAQKSRSAMPCHHMMAESKAAESRSSESVAPSFQSGNDDCCQRHCCCGAITSEWAQPAASWLSSLNLTIEPAQTRPVAIPQSTGFFGHDSARAPPRS